MTVDYGHTSYEAAFLRGDVYGVRADPARGAYAGLLENVLDAVRGSGALLSTGWDAAAAVELIEATKLSLESCRPVDLPLQAAGHRTPAEKAR